MILRIKAAERRSFLCASRPAEGIVSGGVSSGMSSLENAGARAIIDSFQIVR